MVYVTVAENRQITLPFDVFKRLGLKTGDKLAFEEKQGNITLKNASVSAIEEAQENFSGAAEAANINSDEDIMNLVREIRYGKA